MTTTPRILVADDDRLMRALLSDTLESVGYTVVVAANGEEALMRVRADLPDLILLDILMPKLNGIQVAKELKSDPATSGIPIIMVTSLRGTPAATVSRAEAYLQKPVDLRDLLSRVDRLLRARRSPRRPIQGWRAPRGTP